MFFMEHVELSLCVAFHLWHSASAHAELVIWQAAAILQMDSLRSDID